MVRPATQAVDRAVFNAGVPAASITMPSIVPAAW